MNKVTSVLLIFVILTASLHDTTGRCIRRYGHSCLGGHGKRSQLLPIVVNGYNSFSEDRSSPQPLHYRIFVRGQLATLPAVDDDADHSDLVDEIPQNDDPTLLEEVEKNRRKEAIYEKLMQMVKKRYHSEDDFDEDRSVVMK